MSTFIYHRKYSVFNTPFAFRSNSNSFLINGMA